MDYPELPIPASFMTVNGMKYNLFTQAQVYGCIDADRAQRAAPGVQGGESIDFDQAARLLTCYMEFIKSDVKADDIERHPYLPEIECMVGTLRAAATAQHTPPAAVEGEPTQTEKLLIGQVKALQNLILVQQRRTEQAARLADVARAAPVTKFAPITAAVMLDDGGDSPAFCLMAVFRTGLEAMAALAIVSGEAAAPLGDAQPVAKNIVCPTCHGTGEAWKYGYATMDLVTCPQCEGNEVVPNEAAARPVEVQRVARDAGFNAGTVSALAVLLAFDAETQWREVLKVAGKDAILQYAAHEEPDDWEFGGFDKYIGEKPAAHGIKPTGTEGGAS